MSTKGRAPTARRQPGQTSKTAITPVIVMSSIEKPQVSSGVKILYATRTKPEDSTSLNQHRNTSPIRININRTENATFVVHSTGLPTSFSANATEYKYVVNTEQDDRTVEQGHTEDSSISRQRETAPVPVSVDSAGEISDDNEPSSKRQRVSNSASEFEPENAQELEKEQKIEVTESEHELDDDDGEWDAEAQSAGSRSRGRGRGRGRGSGKGRGRGRRSKSRGRGRSSGSCRGRLQVVSEARINEFKSKIEWTPEAATCGIAAWDCVQRSFDGFLEFLEQRIGGFFYSSKAKKDYLSEQNFSIFMDFLLSVDAHRVELMRDAMPNGLNCMICKERIANPPRDDERAQDETAEQEMDEEQSESNDVKPVVLPNQQVGQQESEQVQDGIAPLLGYVSSSGSDTPTTSQRKSKPKQPPQEKPGGVRIIQTETRATPAKYLKGVRPRLPPIREACHTLRDLLMHMMNAHGRVWLPSDQAGSTDPKALAIMYLAVGEYVCAVCEQRAMPNLIHYKRHATRCATWNETRQCEHCGISYLTRLEVRHRKRWCPYTATNPRFIAPTVAVDSPVPDPPEGQKEMRQSARLATHKIRKLTKQLGVSDKRDVYDDSDDDSKATSRRVVSVTESEISSESSDEDNGDSELDFEEEEIRTPLPSKSKRERVKRERIPVEQNSAERSSVGTGLNHRIRKAFLKLTDSEWAAHRLAFYVSRHRRTVQRLDVIFPLFKNAHAQLCQSNTDLDISAILRRDSLEGMNGVVASAVCPVTGLRKFSLPLTSVYGFKSNVRNAVIRQLHLFETCISESLPHPSECKPEFSEASGVNDSEVNWPTSTIAFCGAPVCMLEWNSSPWLNSTDMRNESFSDVDKDNDSSRVMLHLAVVSECSRFIQIWRLDEPTETSNPEMAAKNGSTGPHIQVESLIELDHYPSGFAWLPVSIHERKQHLHSLAGFINLAAVSYRTGGVELILVPRPEHESTLPAVLKPVRVARLVSSDGECPTCVRWCAAEVNVIGVGYASGIVALFDVTHVRDATQAVPPFRSLRIHTQAIRSIEFSPVSSRHIVAVGVGRQRVAVWDAVQRETMPLINSVSALDTIIFAAHWLYRPPFAPYTRFFRIVTQADESVSSSEARLNAYRKVVQSGDRVKYSLLNSEAFRNVQTTTVRKAYCSAYERLEHSAILVGCDMNRNVGTSTVQMRMLHPAVVSFPPKMIFRENTTATVSLGYSPWLDTCLAGNANGEINVMRLSPEITYCATMPDCKRKYSVNKRVVASCDLRLQDSQQQTQKVASVLCAAHSDGQLVDPSCKSCLIQFALLELRESRRGRLVDANAQQPAMADAHFLERAHGLHNWTHIAFSPHPLVPFLCVAATPSGLLKFFNVREAWCAEGTTRVPGSIQPIDESDLIQLLRACTTSAATQ